MCVIYQARGPDVPDLWLTIESPGAGLLPLQLWKVAEGTPGAGTKRIWETGGGWIWRTAGAQGVFLVDDGKSHPTLDWSVPVELADLGLALLGRLVFSRNPALGFRVPCG